MRGNERPSTGPTEGLGDDVSDDLATVVGDQRAETGDFVVADAVREPTIARGVLGGGGWSDAQFGDVAAERVCEFGNNLSASPDGRFATLELAAASVVVKEGQCHLAAERHV